MDLPLLLFTLVAFAVAGKIGQREYQGLRRRCPESSLADFHRKPGSLRFVLLLLLGLMVPSLYFAVHRASLWRMPVGLELTVLWWSNGLGAVLFGLLFGLSWAAFRQETLQNNRALVMTTVLCQAALLFNTAWLQRPIANALSDNKWSGTMLLQTSGSSCAAASGANAAGLLGFRFSEREMAAFMGTRASGTSPAFIIRGLRKAGIEGRKFSASEGEFARLPLPAILIVDHPGAGPESHAVLAIRFHPDKEVLEIWNPLTGSQMLTQARLRQIWRGHGIACRKP